MTPRAGEAASQSVRRLQGKNCRYSRPQPVESPLEEHERAETLSRFFMVACSVYGDHEADIALQNRFFAAFATGIALPFKKKPVG